MKKVNKIITMIIVMMLILIGFSSYINANYQSNNGTAVSTSVYTYLTGIRAMEGSGQVMGLQETYDGSTLKASTTSNNIDVHMVKNTEWGAMALLSASQDYGKKGEGTARYVVAGSGLKTTTGNAYGIYITGNSNFVAAGGGFWGNYDNRYKNEYNVTYAGEAKLNWHEKKGITTGKPWDHTVYYRGNGGIFQWSYDYARQSSTRSRAAITNGEGI